MLRLIRIENLLFIVLFQYLLRYFIILPVLASYGIDPVMTHWQFAVLVTATVFMAASGNVINDYFDIYVDRINRPKTIVLDRLFERKIAILVHVLLTLVAIFLGMYIAFATRRVVFVLLFLGIPIVLWFYSTHFKRQMLIGNIVVATLTGIMAYLVVSVELSFLDLKDINKSNSEGCMYIWYYCVAYSFFAFLCNLTREIIKDIEDIEGDSEYGCKTLPIMLGVGYTKVVVSFLNALTIIMLWSIYCISPALQSHPYSELYLTIGLTLPIIVNTLLLYKAESKAEIHRCSLFCKIIMLIGVLSTLYFWLI